MPDYGYVNVRHSAIAVVPVSATSVLPHYGIAVQWASVKPGGSKTSGSNNHLKQN